MKVIFLDWHRWTFPPDKNSLKKLLIKCGVECKDMKPAPVNSGNSNLLIKSNHKPQNNYRGFDVKSMIKAGVLRETKWYVNNSKVTKKYMVEVMEYIDWAFKIFEEEKPNYIVIEGGLTHFHRAILEVARELNIGIIAIENSFIKDKIFIEFNTGYVCNRHSFARCSKDWINTRVLNSFKIKKVDNIIQSIFSKNNLKYPTTGNFDYSQLKYDKTIFVPLQVAFDQVVVYDSKFNNKTFIEEVMKIFTKYFKNWNIIFKCHPKEEKSGILRQTGNWIQDNISNNNMYLIRGAEESPNTQNLIQHADLVWVNNSQAGLEACLLDKPVVVFGDAFYSKKGFTLEYNKYINWKEIKLNPESIKNIDQVKLWFYYFYKWLYNKSFTKQDEEKIKNILNIQEKENG